MMNRLQHPLLPLNSEEAIDQFLDTSIDVVETTGFLDKNKDNKQVAGLGDHYMKLKYKTRVLVFTYEKEDFEAEIKTLKKVGRLLSQRLSIRIGFVEDRELIRLYKKRYSSNWFIDLVFSNAIVLQRFDKKIIPVDIYNLQGTKLLLKEFSKGSLLSLNKLDKETQRLLEMTGQNIVVGVVSLDNKDEKIR